MKINIIKIIIVITIIIGWLTAAKQINAVIKKAGNIEVVTDEPLFADSIIWYPGLTVEKSFQVKNRGRGAKTAQIKAENGTQAGRLAEILTVRINQGNRGIYGVSETKTLRDFFDSAGVSLGEVFPDDSGKVFSAAILMPVTAGNEYQGSRAKFDLRIGFLGESQSSVTVAGGTTEGKEGTPAESWRIQAGEEGQEGERQNPGTSGESGKAGESAGEVKGEETEGINWKFLAIISGLLAFAGLAAGAWLRLRRKQVY